MIKVVLLAAGLSVAAAWLAADGIRAALPGAPSAPLAARATLEEPRAGTATLRADADGHFRVDATVGGKRVPMLVDTGATVVALSHEIGEQLGLVSGLDRYDARVSTANGSVGAKRVVLRDVRVGSVKVDEVAAVVLAPGAMDGALLGMSFLGRLRRLETSRDRLTMER
ncbi:retropepsin-like aspartic protease family protein [Chenggangzhangella methanolivorans]|uniref:TIGR02281 family clan AA aspartic protease n=1 Tax=Chenggangzhangella methanolivorans TaxID=1437009 RepID=A0A9E6REF7_9HYPH|nr:TIGR02281 family clan AA aspartic protease [Chenggangzhangella methanolivorans]QZO01959.1 TIGR02281 family clan AA aspartic protease [Chenggangzhangella methanolivorans]